MKIINNSALHLTFIILCAILLNLLPFLISGIPLQQQLLSDVEYHISTWQIALNPNVLAGDKFLQLGLKTLPTGQILSNKIVGFIAKSFNLDLFTISVLLSFFALLLFLCALYILILYSLKDPLTAFLISFFSIIPVHALGSAIFGVQALGFLPRDLSLAVAVIILVLYFYSLQNKKSLKLVFFTSGILANFYPLIFFQLVIVLLLAEIIRSKKINFTYVGHGLIFLAGALPSALDILLKNTQASPIDIEIMRSFYKYMIADFSWDSLRHYLRRFILYSMLVPVIYYFSIRKAPEPEKGFLRPWIAIAVSSFIFSLIGAFIEGTTVLTKYMLSRTSVWFTLSSMVITASGLKMFFEKYTKRRALLYLVVAASFIYLAQSNLPTTYRFLRSTYNNREQTREFHIAVDKLNKMTNENDLILAPSEEYYDLAASVRTYSLRPIYVCYKYGGISVMDGLSAREWLQRYRKASDVFQSKDPRELINFMEAEGIHYAFVPSHYYKKDDQFIKEFIVEDTGRFLIIKH